MNDDLLCVTRNNAIVLYHFGCMITVDVVLCPQLSHELLTIHPTRMLMFAHAIYYDFIKKMKNGRLSELFARKLIVFVCVYWCPIHILFCLSSYCVPYVASFSGLSIFDCPIGILSRLSMVVIFGVKT